MWLHGSHAMLHCRIFTCHLTWCSLDLDLDFTLYPIICARSICGQKGTHWISIFEIFRIDWTRAMSGNRTPDRRPMGGLPSPSAVSNWMDESGSDYSGSLFSLHLQFAGTPAVPKPRAIAVAPVAPPSHSPGPCPSLRPPLSPSQMTPEHLLRQGWPQPKLGFG